MAIPAKKRAQASFEYLTIMMVALIILVPMVYMFQRYTLQSAENIQLSKIKTIGEDLVNTAETVYYMGYPARLTIQEEFPSGIASLNLTTAWSQDINIISFYLPDGREMAYFCGVNINSTITPGSYSAGLKNIVFETRNSTQGNYVQIIFK